MWKFALLSFLVFFSCAKEKRSEVADVADSLVRRLISSPAVKWYAMKATGVIEWSSAGVQKPPQFDTLRSLGDSVVPDLISLLDDKNDTVRLAACLSLGMITGQQFGDYADYFSKDQRRRTENIATWKKKYQLK